MIKQGVLFMIQRQRKLTGFLLGAGLLLGGLFVPCSDVRYEAFSLAVAGIMGLLVGSHALQTIKSPKNQGSPDGQ